MNSLPRDPRFDPRPGDIVELYNGARGVVLKRILFLVYVEFSHGYGRQWLLIPRWREWSKNASVVHVAPDGESAITPKKEAES